jgi:hypothetical protein
LSKTDFWWTSQSQKDVDMCVEFGHHDPIREDDQPCSAYWEKKTCPLGYLNDWRNKFNNTNVYRSLRVFDGRSGGPELLGPFLVDIDNECGNLEDALCVSQRVAKHMIDSHIVDMKDLRIFFTGHKGFNFEIRPQMLAVQGSIQEQIEMSAKILDKIICFLRNGNTWQPTNQVSIGGTCIDRIYGNKYGYGLKHAYVRLHNSINKWITADGQPMARGKIKLTFDDLNKLTIEKIITKSENC